MVSHSKATPTDSALIAKQFNQVLALSRELHSSIPCKKWKRDGSSFVC